MILSNSSCYLTTMKRKQWHCSQSSNSQHVLPFGRRNATNDESTLEHYLPCYTALLGRSRCTRGPLLFQHDDVLHQRRLLWSWDFLVWSGGKFHVRTWLSVLRCSTSRIRRVWEHLVLYWWGMLWPWHLAQNLQKTSAVIHYQTIIQPLCVSRPRPPVVLPPLS